MSVFTIYFSASTNDVIVISADDWELDNHNILSFKLNGNPIACFNMNNIYGFEENIPVSDLAGKNAAKTPKAKSAER